MSLVEQETIQLEFVVGPHCDGWRLDQYLCWRIPRLSRNRIQRIIRAQRDFGGDALRPAMRVRRGQWIRLIRPAPDEPDVPRTYELIHEDEALLAICKPAGLPVHATARFHRNTLTAVLQERFPKGHIPRLVHRLDRETSGLMLLARTREAEVALKGQLARRQVRKRYWAIVRGKPAPSGTIDFPIGPDAASGIRVKRGVDVDGLPAQTEFRRLEQRADYALVEALPTSGRQHQIRLHLSAIGYPIVGDKLYGPDPGCLLEYLEQGWTESLARRLVLPRHALHAAGMQFKHPVSGEPMNLECPLPRDLVRFWEGVRSAVG